MTDQQERIQTSCLLLLSMIAIAAVLYLLRGLLIPFVIALFLGFLLQPVIEWQVRRLRIPRGLALASAILAAIGVLVLVGVVIGRSVSDIASQRDTYVTRVGVLMDDGLEFLDRHGIDTDKVQTAIDSLEGKLPVLVRGVVENLLGLFTQGFLVLLYVIFMVLGTGRGDAMPSPYWSAVSDKVRRYLAVKLFLSLLTGSLVGGTLAVLGVPMALVFGLFTFFLNFIPNIGSPIAVLLPVPVLLASESLSSTEKMLAIAIPAGIQIVIGNVLDTKLMGRTMDLHPVTVLLALIFWGTMWGFVGVVLSVPITASVKILLEHLPQTLPMANLMAGRPMNAPLLEPEA